MLSKNTIKRIGLLKQKKYRQEFEQFLVEGVKGVEEALKSGAAIALIVVEGNRRDEKEIADIIKTLEHKNIKTSVPIEYAGRQEIANIKSTDSFPGIMAIIERPDIDLDDLDLTKPIVCLDRINDPGNLGTIIRTADWFGVPNIILSEDSVDPYNEKAVRSTMGSIFHTKIFESDDIVQTLGKLKEKGYNVIVLDMKGNNIRNTKFTNIRTTNCFVFGGESHGVSKEILNLADEVLAIPGDGKAESLNVSIAVGITLFHEIPNPD